MPNLATGDGTEAFYRYDDYAPGSVSRTADFSNPPDAAIGRLVSIEDLGAHTRFSYDERGRIRRTERRLVKPSAPSSVLADRFTSHWFRQEAEFDLGDRLRRRTLGLEGPPFPVGSEETFTYSARGTLKEIGSSQGMLVSELRNTAGSLPLSATYGDLAGTRTAMGYDPNDRLRKWQTSRAAAPALWTLPPTLAYSQPGADTTQMQLTSLEFSYDDIGNVLAINDGSADSWPAGARPVSRRFSYDAAYRITEVDYAHGADQQVPVFLHEALAKDRRPVSERPGQQRLTRQSFATDWQGNVAFSDDNESLRFDRSLGKVLHGKGLDGVQKGPNQLLDADGIHAGYDAAGNLTDLTVARAKCWDRMPDCSHRFRYDWDAVGQLMRARRWDHAAGPVPALAVNAPPAIDASYAYSEGVRMRSSLAGTAVPGGIERHTLEVFDTLRVQGTSYQPNASAYSLAPETQIGLAGGIGRVFLDRSRLLPMAGADPVHVYLTLHDFQGSAAFTIDKDSGEVVERGTHQAFGATESDHRPERWAAARDEFKFTGKEEAAELGVTYFGARYYHPRLARWMSPDPLAVHGLAGDLNPYAYVSGRMANLIDPTGLDPIPADLSDVQFHAGGGWSGVNKDGMLEFGNGPEPGSTRDPVSIERLSREDQLRMASDTLDALQYANQLIAHGNANQAYRDRRRQEAESPWADAYVLLDMALGEDTSLVDVPDHPYGVPVQAVAAPNLRAAAMNAARSQALTIQRATRYNRVPFNFSARELSSYKQPAGTLCPACQARPIAEGGHATPAVQLRLAADVDLITEQDAITIARSRGNYIDLCRNCNRSQGSKLIGTHPGHWVPPNPSQTFLDYLESLGALMR